MRGLSERFACVIHLRLVARLERLLGIRNRVLHIATLAAGDLISLLAQHLLDLVDQRVELVLGLDLLALGFVLSRVRIRVLGHALDFLLRQARRRRNRDLLVLARGHVFRGHVQDAVRVDVERHLNLRHAARSRRKAGQVEFAQRAVLRRHGPLTLQHVHLDRGLVVRCGRERLRLARRNCSVARDHRRRHAAQRFNRQRQRSHVQQEQIFHFTLEDAALNGRADCHDFVRVHALVAFPAEQLLHQRLDARHTRLSADQHHFVDLRSIHARVFHALFAGADRTLNDVLDHRLQLRPRQFLHQVFRTAGVGGNKRQIDLMLHRGRKLDLRPLRRVTQTLQRHLIALAAQIEPFVSLEFVN